MSHFDFEFDRMNTSNSLNNVNVSIIFNFDIDSELDEEVCNQLGVDVKHSSDLNDDEYDDLCNYYCVPRLHDNVVINLDEYDLDAENIDSNELRDIVSDRYGWLATSVFIN